MTKSVIWLDHQHADIFLLAGDTAKETDVSKLWDYKHLRLHEQVPHDHFRMHMKKNKNAGRFSPDEHKFYEAVEAEVKSCDEVLVIGPGFAKAEFVKHAMQHVNGFGDKLCGVETVDHPTARQLVHFARDYFELDAEDALAHLHDLARKHSATH